MGSASICYIARPIAAEIDCKKISAVTAPLFYPVLLWPDSPWLGPVADETEPEICDIMFVDRHSCALYAYANGCTY